MTVLGRFHYIAIIHIKQNGFEEGGGGDRYRQVSLHCYESLDSGELRNYPLPVAIRFLLTIVSYIGYVTLNQQDTVQPLIAATFRSKAKWPMMESGRNSGALLNIFTNLAPNAFHVLIRYFEGT